MAQCWGSRCHDQPGRDEVDEQSDNVDHHVDGDDGIDYSHGLPPTSHSKFADASFENLQNPESKVQWPLHSWPPRNLISSMAM